LARSLVSFAQDTGAEVIAEGIETEDELDIVRQLGIPYGQGYFIGRPGPTALLRQGFVHVGSGAVRQGATASDHQSFPERRVSAA
jgi:EAL domain-containing protein (putative c-di-GMP-specific phosphodiesterase class I)